MRSHTCKISASHWLYNSHPRYQTTIVFLTFGLLFMIMLGLSACSSPEQRKKERQAVLEKFVTQVAKHMFDRNPATIRESMTHLFREELTEPVIQKLQNEGNLPKTELGIVKIVTEAEESHTTNLVNVDSVKVLDQVEKDIVPFQVGGQVTTKTKGKSDQFKTFSMKVTCKLNEQTGDWPQVVDISGLVPAAKQPASKGSQPARRHKHRRH